MLLSDRSQIFPTFLDLQIFSIYATDFGLVL